MTVYDPKKHDIFPGHALVIAVTIMKKYASLEEAKKPASSKGHVFDFPAALGDQDIPGGGGPVYCALHMLKIPDDDKAIKYAQSCWEGECSGGYKDRYEPGVIAAKELEPLFRELRSKWSIK